MGIDEEIKAKKEELKKLKENLKARKEEEKKERTQKRALEDLQLTAEKNVVNAIKACLFDYNKKGKKAKVEFNLKRELELIITSLEEERE